jgi:hypothetical protein
MAILLVEKAIHNLIERLKYFEKGPPNTLEESLEHLIDAHYRFFMDSGEEFVLLFQGRVLVKLQRETAEELEGSYSQYLCEIEKLVSPYISKKTDFIKIRRLACAVAGFVFGFFSFAMIGMEQQAIENSLRPLRKAFLRSVAIFLE